MDLLGRRGRVAEGANKHRNRRFPSRAGSVLPRFLMRAMGRVNAGSSMERTTSSGFRSSDKLAFTRPMALIKKRGGRGPPVTETFVAVLIEKLGDATAASE